MSAFGGTVSSARMHLTNPIEVVPNDRIEKDVAYVVSGERLYRLSLVTWVTKELRGTEKERVRRWILRTEKKK